jgi:hypothetical protein
MDFDMKTVVACLGCIVLALFVMYICTNMMKFNRTVVEGLTSGSSSTPDQLLKDIKTMKTKLVDSLHVNKYKNEYHKILLGTEDVLHLQMLEHLKTAIDKKKIDDPKTLSSLAQLESAKSALKDLDEFLTHFKSS